MAHIDPYFFESLNLLHLHESEDMLDNDDRLKRVQEYKLELILGKNVSLLEGIMRQEAKNTVLKFGIRRSKIIHHVVY
jgi:hypothetical protein